jgi:L-iditol 2-dehydrogenase
VVESNMKAAMYYGIRDVRVEDVPDPQAGPGEVVIQVEAATTCGTDVKMYNRGHVIVKWDELPMGFGHECAGTVVEVGEGVTKFKPGDRVATHNTGPCGVCFYCKRGQNSMCENSVSIRGAFAEYVRIPAAVVRQNVFHIPPGLSFQTACLLEPLSCAVYGVDEIGIELGDIVVVNGAGPIGLMIARLAALRGAHVISCDLSGKRLAVARRLGAAQTVNVSEVADQVQAVRALTPQGRGADVAIEAVGYPEVWERTVQMARRGGRVLLFGGSRPGTTFTVSTELMHYSQLTLKGVFHTTPLHVSKAFDLLCRKVIDAQTFVTGRYALTDIVEAIEAHGRQDGIKNEVVVRT